MFKKNSMEFFTGLQLYLYYYYSGCTLKSYDHMFFPECSMITWSYHVIWLYWVSTLFISLLHCMLWGFGLSVQMCGKSFPVWGSYNNCAYFCLQAMPAIRNTKTLAERLSLKKESATKKSLLERIEMEPTLSTKLYDRLVEADPC